MSSSRILVSGFPDGTSEIALTIYFQSVRESGGGDITLPITHAIAASNLKKIYNFKARQCLVGFMSLDATSFIEATKTKYAIQSKNTRYMKYYRFKEYHKNKLNRVTTA
ncbi:hypothetical protein pdam_00011105, partial [Pocillopora damicornis]